MWIKMLRDQVKPWGVLGIGQTHSLSAREVDQLDKDSYIEVEVDDQAMRRMGVEERIQRFTAEIATLDSAIASARQRLADLRQRRKLMADKISRANSELKQLSAARSEAKTQTEGASDGQSATTEPAAGESAGKGPAKGD